MKICLYGYTIATKGSGARQYALDLGQWLVKGGNKVTLVTGKWGDRSDLSDGIETDFVVSHNSPVKKGVQINFAIRSMLYFWRHRRDFDLIHSLSSFPQFARLAPWIKRVTGLPVIHTLLAPCEPQPFFNSLDGLISVSRGIQEKIQIPHTVYIPPLLDLEKFRSSSHYGWNHPGDTFIGTMGAPFRRKGIRYLVEAIPLVLRQNPNIHFFLAIDLPGIQFMEETRRERAYIERFIQEHGLHEKIDILGPVDVPRFLKSLDLFVYAVQTTMGMIDIPPTILEALAAGCGLVTSPKGGIGEVVKDRYNGLLVSSGEEGCPQAYAEKILGLLQNRSLLKTIRENGPPSVEGFDLNQVGRQMVQFYEKVLSNRG
jgi:glycosyltransferase involved in cell wall biosynthesis